MPHAELLHFIRADQPDSALAILAAEPGLCANDDDPSALMLALYHRAPQIAATIAARRHFLTVFEAAALGSTDALRHMLRSTPTAALAFSEDGFTALHLACFFGHADSVGVLLQSGADANAVASNGSLLRPLHSAATQGSIAIARLLLDSGADPDATQQSGFTALHAAALRGDTALARLLIERGACIDAKADDGRSAGDVASAAGHDWVV